MANIRRTLRDAYREWFVSNPFIKKAPNCSYVFIHINKTGGASVAKALGIPFMEHYAAREIISSVGEKRWESAFKFAFVRNPFSKVVSHYNYRIKTNKTNLKTYNLSFKEWVKRTYGYDKDYFYYDKPKMFMPQVEWLKDNNNQLDIDFIGRFERMHIDFNIVCSMLGVYKDLPHLKTFVKHDYRSYYDTETIDIIYDWFYEDFETFRYRFDGNK
jgi:hypothetical protein